MKTTIRCLFLSYLIVPVLGIGSPALAQKAVPLSEQEKTVVNQGITSTPSSASAPKKTLPATKVVKKKSTSTTATSATAKPSTSIKKTSALPVTPAYTPPAVKGVTKQTPAATATGVSTKPSTGIRKTTTLPVTPSYTPPAASFPQVSGKPPVQQSGAISITPRSGYVAPSFTPPPATVGTGVSGQGPGVKSTGTYVAPTNTPPSLSLPSKTVGVGTAVQGQGQGIQTPSGAYVIPHYDPPRSGPLGSGAPAGQPGSATTAPRSGSVPLFPVSAGTGAGGQEQGVKTTDSFLTPSSTGGKGVAPSSETGSSISSSTPPPVADNIERLRLLREKYGKSGTKSGNVPSDGTSSKTAEAKGKAGDAATSQQTTSGGGTVSTSKTGKTASAMSLEAASAASAASGTLEAGAKKESEGQVASPGAAEAAIKPGKRTGAAGASALGSADDTDQPVETAADREKDLRERFNIPDDVPIKSTAEALGFAKQIEALGGKVTPETWREQKEKGSDEVVGKQVRETFGIPDDVPVKNPQDAVDFAEQFVGLGGKPSPETWRTWRDKGSDEVVGKQVRETFGIPDDVPVGSIKDAIDFARDVQMLTGNNTPEAWRLRQEKGSKAATKEIICKTYELPDCSVVGSPEDLLKGIAEGERLGVPLQELPDFIKDWDRQRNGGITLDELLNKWMPGAKPGIDRGGLPGGGLPGGPGSGSSGLPGPPTGPGGLSGGTGFGGVPGDVPGTGSGRPGSLVDVMNEGFGIGAIVGGGSGTGMPGAPGGGSSGTGTSSVQGVGGGRGVGGLDPLATGTGIGAPGQGSSGQGQGAGSGILTAPGSGSGGTGSGSGGSSSSGLGGAAPSGGNENSPSGVGVYTQSGGTMPCANCTYARFTSDGAGGYTMTVSKTDDEGNVTSTNSAHYSQQKDGTWKNEETGETITGQPQTDGVYAYENDSDGNANLVFKADKSDSSSGSTGSSTGNSGSTTSSGSTGSGTSSSGSTTSTGGTQGTGEEEGQSGMYNPDDDSLYRRRGMSAEERAKAMEDFQKLKPVDGGRGGEGGGQRRTGLKVSDVNTMEIMKSKTDPYITPNPDADQGSHSGPIPVGDERGNIEQPVPEGDHATPGFGRMGGATRPGGGQSGTGGGFDPRVAGEEPE